MVGRILQLSIKPQTPGEFGLPKRAVPELRVTRDGAEGDFNNYRTRELHSDPDLALLLLTREVIDGLRTEGWPVQPGDLGENLTLGGIPESSLGPGVRLQAGAVELLISKACDPCTETYVLPYIGPERGPAFVKTLVGRRGWYARVLSPGTLHLDTPVRLV